MNDFIARTILVVDDEPVNRRLIQAILAPEGGKIIHAPDGATALSILRQGKIDLVLLDVMMPGIDGIEVCRRIRDRSRGDYIPVVLVTALADGDSRARGAAAGADDFLTKPVHQDELLARARNLLRMRAYHELVERQHREAETEARRWRLMAEVAGAVAVCRDYQHLLQQMHAALAPHVPVDCAAVFDVAGDHLVLKASAGRHFEADDRPRLAWDAAAWAAHVPESAALQVASGSAGPLAGIPAALGLGEVVAMPVYGAGALHGMFVVAREVAFSPDDVAMLGKLAPHIGNAVNNVRLHVRAEHLLRAREELTQLIVHDLRNPLSAAQTNIELALEDEITDEDRPDILRDARRATQRVVALVSDLLDTSAAEEGRLRLQPRAQDLAELCRSVASQCAPLFGATYEIQLSGDAVLPATVDGKLLCRVLENIVGNATRYVKRNGRIELALEHRGDHVMLAISNDGPTIPAAVRAWLFQKYAGESQTGRTRGLGLYFCRLVVEAHGGTIRETAPETGVRFEICLPASLAAAAPVAA